ncbi:proline-rich receptor-like protein kinase PERK3 isoform X2 [Lycium barbarum]|uniref:proline-rich receptor-like protein kinase PERK3 isoform X2 n=1 Tax=Lycium ferocissimum TaxID=112874 RepID=UPI0028152CFC|nr:proline-rich receptor-like protein kinase PERK3 isoform X2 [Lycium ferocissimum]XP_060197833.1 proline-rich receptor-like protein kinase PERK3 isoform X2 [Lycium barbarum]
MASSFVPIAGGIGGAVLLLGVICFVCFRAYRSRKNSNKNSDSASSDPSAVVEMKREASFGPSRLFRMEELEKATNHFDENNLIGCGSFGLVFKGLLCDGTVVAIKRRLGIPKQEFTEEVAHLSRVQHRNLVSLLGYCQDSGYSMLVFEYLPNGSMRNHLYDTGRESATKLEFKQRLSIAIGTAKGLSHLHGQRPSIIHGNFKTANVLVDEDFIAKVADAGILKLLEKIDDAGPSGLSSVNAFRDPEINQIGILCETSDVYSFGVFLIELITGRDASHIDEFGSNQSVLDWVEKELSSEDLVDHRLMGSFTGEVMKDLIKIALRCMSFPGRYRPTMETVVLDLERLLEREIMHTTGMGEGTSTVTLGSQLFTN